MFFVFSKTVDELLHIRFGEFKGASLTFHVCALHGALQSKTTEEMTWRFPASARTCYFLFQMPSLEYHVRPKITIVSRHD
jgi:hypothetical protein